MGYGSASTWTKHVKSLCDSINFNEHMYLYDILKHCC